jgi:hypothetical protein
MIRDDGHANWGCRVLRKNSDARTVLVRTINKNISATAPIAGRSSAHNPATAALTMKNPCMSGQISHGRVKARRFHVVQSFHAARRKENEVSAQPPNFGNSLSGLFPRVARHGSAIRLHFDSRQQSPPQGT